MSVLFSGKANFKTRNIIRGVIHNDTEVILEQVSPKSNMTNFLIRKRPSEYTKREQERERDFHIMIKEGNDWKYANRSQ